LGTYVDITASGLEAEALPGAVNAAFDSVARIQCLMSVHDEQSEVSLLNREAAYGQVGVSDETYEVLGRAVSLAAESCGAFDPTLAPALARWGYVPARWKRRSAGNWRHVRLCSRNRVFFERPLALDLGGIAKGFAVDQAVAVLKALGVSACVVNAGGDLRVSGTKAVEVALRYPSGPLSTLPAFKVADTALATSAPYATERVCRGRRVSHLINPLNGEPVLGAVSVTVQAPECWLADALTKVVWHAGNLAEEILARHRAAAWRVAA
jgi:thiamine biosynthesis lipoprotein